MKRDLIIGVDAGTSVIKAVAFDLEGRQVAMASVPNQVLLGPDGAAEQDLDGTWAHTAATLRALAERVPDLAARAVALAATGQGDGTWLIDAEGRPVGPAMLWLDARASREVQALRETPASRRLAARTGNALSLSMQSGQLLWLRAHQPERLARAASAMHCKDWLFFKATGVRATSPCEGVYTFGDFRSLAYDDDALAWLGLTDLKHLLPPIVDGTRSHAPLSRSAAAETGLPEGLPVVLPLMDVPLCVLGAGGVAFDAQGALRHVGCSVLGSTGMHGWVTDNVAAIVPSAEAGYTIAMPSPGLRVRLVSHMAATLNIDWLVGLLGSAAELAGATALPRARMLERLDALVLSTAPAQAVYHPYIAESGERGPFVDANARAQLSGFSATLGVAGLARAVFEGIAMATRDCYAALGALPEEIRLSGGAARSLALRQMVASVTGRPVRVSNREECGAAGAAIMAALSIDSHASIHQMLPQWVDAYLDEAVTLPDPGQTALYDQIYRQYHETAQRAGAPWQALAEIRRAHLAVPVQETQ
ncbi:MAG: FGGY-family carbohydrate kinase [Pseudomonadota bacterium]